MTDNSSKKQNNSKRNKNNSNKKLIKEINELKEQLEIKNEEIQELEYELSLKDEKIEDIRNDLELKSVEIDEYSQKIDEKDKKITDLNNTLIKYKFEKEKLDLKLKNEINYEKSRMKEMDDLEKKINEKIAIECFHLFCILKCSHCLNDFCIVLRFCLQLQSYRNAINFTSLYACSWNTC